MTARSTRGSAIRRSEVLIALQSLVGEELLRPGGGTHGRAVAAAPACWRRCRSPSATRPMSSGTWAGEPKCRRVMRATADSLWDDAPEFQAS